MIGLALLPLAARAGVSPAQGQAADPTTVTVHNFARAETGLYLARLAKDTGIGKLSHRLAPASIDEQDEVRMNRDTLYSSGVFDLGAAPLTITLPDPGRRFTFDDPATVASHSGGIVRRIKDPESKKALEAWLAARE
jgi:hypothetical protein